MGLFDSGGGLDIQQVSNLTGGQRKLLSRFTTGLRRVAGQALTPQGPLQIADISPLQQQAFGAFGGLGPIGLQGLGIAQQGLQQFDPSLSQGFLGQAQGALAEGLQGFDPQRILSAFEPSRQLARRQFERNTLPNILERFGATSGSSGALNRALAEAGRDLELGLSAQTAPFLGQAALQAPGQQFAGAQIAGNLAQLPGQLASQQLGIGAAGSDILGQLLNVGGVQRGIAQEPLTAQFQADREARDILSQFAPLALGTQAFSNVAQQPQPGLGQSLLPALGAFAGSPTGSAALGGLASGAGSAILGGGGAALGGLGALAGLI